MSLPFHSDLTSPASSSSLLCLKLDDSNFGVWKERMIDGLMSRKLWRYAAGTTTRSERDPGTADKDHQKAVTEWEDNDNTHPHACDRLSAAPRLRQHIRCADLD